MCQPSNSTLGKATLCSSARNTIRSGLEGPLTRDPFAFATAITYMKQSRLWHIESNGLAFRKPLWQLLWQCQKLRSIGYRFCEAADTILSQTSISPSSARRI